MAIYVGTSNAGNLYLGTSTIKTIYIGTSIGYQQGGEVEIVDWATGTDAEIMAMVRADRRGDINLRDYWSVGDTRQITTNYMAGLDSMETNSSQTIEMVLMDTTCRGFQYTEATSDGRVTPRFIVGQKNSLNGYGVMNNGSGNHGGWSSSRRRSWCNSTYRNGIPSTIRDVFKQFTWQQGMGGLKTSGLNTTNDYFAFTPAKSILGSGGLSQNDEADLYDLWEWYQNTENRIKTRDGSADFYWCGSPVSNSQYGFCAIQSNGGASSGTENHYGIAPFGVI